MNRCTPDTYSPYLHTKEIVIVETNLLDRRFQHQVTLGDLVRLFRSEGANFLSLSRSRASFQKEFLDLKDELLNENQDAELPSIVDAVERALNGQRRTREMAVHEFRGWLVSQSWWETLRTSCCIRYRVTEVTAQSLERLVIELAHLNKTTKGQVERWRLEEVVSKLPAIPRKKQQAKRLKPPETSSVKKPAAAGDYREYRVGGRPRGEFLTALVIETKFKISASALSKHPESHKNRLKHPVNRKAFIFRWSFIKKLADAKWENE